MAVSTALRGVERGSLDGLWPGTLLGPEGTRFSSVPAPV